LNAIIVFSKLLQKHLKGTLNAKDSDALSSIHNNGTQLINLTNRMIAIAHLESGKTAFKPQKIQISTWLRGLVNEVARTTNASNIDFIFSEHNNQQVYFNLDTSLLNKAIEEILKNSITATPAGKIFVSWKLKSTEHGSKLTIMIRDTGHGVSREKLKYFF
jgi:signal transduction histidine kinase